MGWLECTLLAPHTLMAVNRCSQGRWARSCTSRRCRVCPSQAVCQCCLAQQAVHHCHAASPRQAWTMLRLAVGPHGCCLSAALCMLYWSPAVQRCFLLEQQQPLLVWPACLQACWSHCGLEPCLKYMHHTCSSVQTTPPLSASGRCHAASICEWQWRRKMRQ
jgi:hypothetical protein